MIVTHTPSVNRIWLTLTLALALATGACAQFAVKNGDRVAFYGDSITDNGDYTTFVETFVVTRYPKWDVRFFNAGVGGDRVSGGILGPIDERLKRDLISRNPTLITCMLGMNDAGYRELVPELQDAYGKGYRHILDVLKTETPKARIWLLKPSAFDDVSRPPTIPGGYNSVLLRYGQTVEQVAKEYGHWIADLNFPLADELYRAYALNPTEAAKIIPDRVHPTAAGHLVMAAALLEAWKAPSDPVQVSLDASAGTSRAEGSTITDIHKGSALAWTQLDTCLPFPIAWKDPVTMTVAGSCPAVEKEFLGRKLRVTNLAAGNYVLKVDGESIATVSAGDLAMGIDLNRLETPMSRQAAEVHVLTVKRAYLAWTSWRQLEVGLQLLPSKERDDAVAAMKKVDEDLVRRQRAMAMPRSHRFSVEPA